MESLTGCADQWCWDKSHTCVPRARDDWALCLCYTGHEAGLTPQGHGPRSAKGSVALQKRFKLLTIGVIQEESKRHRVLDALPGSLAKIWQHRMGGIT